MYDIVYLPPSRWKGEILPMRYTTREYYNLSVCRTGSGLGVTFEKRAFDAPVTHTAEEYDFPDRLYADWWEGAEAWGIVRDDALLAAVEFCPEDWSNRLRVTELWVSPALQGQGYGAALMAVARRRAVHDNRRGILLETQSCNVHAIGFYLHEGFTLIGFDAFAYSNRDPARREVRMELGWLNPNYCCPAFL